MLTEEIDVFTEARLPLQERVVDKLADIMFASDMIRDMLDDKRFVEAQRLATVRVAIQGIYDEVNGLMRQLTD